MEQDFTLHPLSTEARRAPATLTSIVRSAALHIGGCTAAPTAGQVGRLLALVGAVRACIAGQPWASPPPPVIGPRDPAVGCSMDSPSVYDFVYDSVHRLLASAESLGVLQDLGNRSTGAMREALGDLEIAVKTAQTTRRN